jgi:hypothetical protein
MRISTIPAVIKRDIPNARLPVNYEAAKKALAECERLDECKAWEDHAAAAASYYRQIKEPFLMEAARRIKLRARERMAEILASIPPAKGRGKVPKGTLDPNSRAAAARAIGLSHGDLASITAIGMMPKHVRNEKIEQSPPISVHDLAQLGKQRNSHLGRRPASAAYNELTASRGLGNFAAFIRLHPAGPLASALSYDESRRVRELVVQIQEWCDEIEQNLPRRRSR